MPSPDTNKQLSPLDTSEYQVSFLDPQVPSPDPPKKQLPNRTKRGVPKPTYEHNLIYMSYDKLFELNMLFVNQLSYVSILSSVQEALVDPK